MNKHPLAVALAVTLIGIILAITHSHALSPAPSPSPSLSPSPTATMSASPSAVATTTATATSTPSAAPSATASRYAEPIADFKARITKKMFGTYVTPQNSPVQPERFTGYHTGVDVEYGDVTADVPVYAIADGVVQQAGFVSGYGGLLVIKHTSDDLYSLYGHMRSSSLPAVGTSITKGHQVGVLGTAFSSETDGERRHLHFAVYKGSPVDIKGYVQNKADLASWEDPLLLY